jgi:hypothetical protein
MGIQKVIKNQLLFNLLFLLLRITTLLFRLKYSKKSPKKCLMKEKTMKKWRIMRIRVENKKMVNQESKKNETTTSSLINMLRVRIGLYISQSSVEYVICYDNYYSLS